MKTYDVNGREVTAGIKVAMEPQPHVVLGAGGNKNATWVAIGRRDAGTIIVRPDIPCPKQGDSDFTTNPATCAAQHRCDQCGEMYDSWKASTPPFNYRYHPKAGTVPGPEMILDVGSMQLDSGKMLIVTPRPSNRVLVLWRFKSGYRGGADITAGDGVKVVATDKAWHSGRGNKGETAELLAIMEPGQELHAKRWGRNLEETHARLRYDGTNIIVEYGDESLFVDEAQGKYL
jgi:hypothetical protein